MRMSLVAVLGVGVVVACTTPTSVCGCSPNQAARALVLGTVRASGDIALRDALISARSTRGSCPARNPLVDAGFSTPTDSTGRYTVYVAPGAPAGDTLCVQVVVYRSASARMDTLVSSAANLQVRDGPPYDSARIDFRFP
jgi:hypothetical protein